MAFRILSVVIIGFWLVMSGLLLRLHFRPASSDVFNVPVEHVARILFTQNHPSELNLMFGGMRYGTVLVRPVQTPGGYELEMAGSALLRVPFMPRDRLMWDSSLKLDTSWAMQSLEGIFTLRESRTKLQFSVAEGAETLQYRIEIGGVPGPPSSVPLSREGAEELLRRAGLDAAALQVFDAGAFPVKVSAKRTELDFRDDKIESYKISVTQEGTVLAEMYVSQLGQILTINTAAGLRLIPDNFLP